MQSRSGSARLRITTGFNPKEFGPTFLIRKVGLSGSNPKLIPDSIQIALAQSGLRPDNPISEVNQMLIDQTSPFLKVNQMNSAIAIVADLKAGWEAAGISEDNQRALLRSMLQPLEEAMTEHHQAGCPAADLLYALDHELHGKA